MLLHCCTAYSENLTKCIDALHDRNAAKSFVIKHQAHLVTNVPYKTVNADVFKVDYHIHWESLRLEATYFV
jgi:hypothetical protein